MKILLTVLIFLTGVGAFAQDNEHSSISKYWLKPAIESGGWYSTMIREYTDFRYQVATVYLDEKKIDRIQFRESIKQQFELAEYMQENNEIMDRIYFLTVLAKNGYLELAQKEMGTLITKLDIYSAELYKSAKYWASNFKNKKGTKAEIRARIEPFLMFLVERSFVFASENQGLMLPNERARMHNFMLELSNEARFDTQKIALRAQAKKMSFRAFYIFYYVAGGLWYISNGFWMATPEWIISLHLPFTIHIAPLIIELLHLAIRKATLSTDAANPHIQTLGTACANVFGFGSGP